MSNFKSTKAFGFNFFNFFNFSNFPKNFQKTFEKLSKNKNNKSC